MQVVTECGVVPDGQTLNTAALQRLIDACRTAGGGTLVFPPGRYLTGGLILCSNLTLQFENGATLLGSGNLEHYPHLNPVPEAFVESAEGLRALLLALDCQNLRLCGPGTIDGQGPLFNRYAGVRAGRPRNIWFGRCQNVAVEGLRLRHAGFWMQHYLKCTGLRLHGLEVFNHGSSNNDGCDIDGCRDVVVSDCSIDSHDDALCLKSGNSWATENVVITNCITRTHCNHFKTGTESNGGFRNITVSNLQMVPSTVLESDPHTGGADYRGACGIALGCVDGGMLENIAISHVQMDQVRVPFFIRLGDRGRPIAGTTVRPPVGLARNITIRQVNARGASAQGCYLIGLPDAPLAGVAIDDCRLHFEGGGAAELVQREVPQNRAGYPSMELFGNLPAFGIFARDVHGLSFQRLHLQTETPDPRPALAWNHCRGVTLDHIETT